MVFPLGNPPSRFEVDAEKRVGSLFRATWVLGGSSSRSCGARCGLALGEMRVDALPEAMRALLIVGSSHALRRCPVGLAAAAERLLPFHQNVGGDSVRRGI